MKYVVLCSIGMMFLGGGAVAGECPAGVGVPLTGNDGVSKYCMSKVSMNWWSAFAWCKSVGGEVIDITVDCVKEGLDESEVACPNLKGVGYRFWTRNVPSKDGAYTIDVPVENPRSWDRLGDQYVVCRI